MRKNLLSILFLAFAVLFVTEARAANVNYGRIVNMVYTGPYNGADQIHIPDNPNPTYTNVGVGPYGLTLDGDAILGMCFNAAAEIAPPFTWTGIVVNAEAVRDLYYPGISGSPAISAARAGAINYLTNLFGTTSSSTDRRRINEAMWEVSADLTTSSSSFQVDGNNALRGSFYLLNSTTTDQNDINAINQLGATAFTHINDSLSSSVAAFVLPISSWGTTSASGPLHLGGYFFTIDYEVQPFALDRPLVHVPEPMTAMTVAFGLLALSVGYRKRH